MREVIAEWVCATANGELLCDENSHKDMKWHLSTFEALLSFGRLLRFGNKKAAAECCRKWNGGIPKNLLGS